jgi:cell division transport system ATP-binding protein
MQLLYRINLTGTTVLVATHDASLVDRMRRRVIELHRGRLIRDEQGGRYDAQPDVTTAEFGALMREHAPARRPRDAFDRIERARGDDFSSTADAFDRIERARGDDFSSTADAFDRIFAEDDDA